MNNNSATHKNILAIKQHSDITREQVTELRKLLIDSQNTINTMSGQIVVLQSQIQALQIKLFTGGATDGNY